MMFDRSQQRSWQVGTNPPKEEVHHGGGAWIRAGAVSPRTERDNVAKMKTVNDNPRSAGSPRD
jgi:hypothetical protein